MCGVIGYVGTQVSPELFYEGLKKLEYRGYDSAGIAVRTGDQIAVVKASGKLSALKERLSELPASTSMGIGHTRWATHGKPTAVNAHPHQSGPMVLLHNGIIENHQPLRTRLEREGFTFSSETDTEVAVHLLHLEYLKRLSINDPHERMIEALREALRQIHGAYAFAIMCADSPNYLYAAKQGSPLVIGRGENGNYIASGIPALVRHTSSIARLEDGDVAILCREGYEIFGRDGQAVSRPLTIVDCTPEMLEKEGYDHFMQKEIFQHPAAVRSACEGRLEGEDFAKEYFEGIDLDSVSRIQAIACGSSKHACMVAKYFIEELTGVPVDVDLASEFRYKRSTLSKGSIVLAISQSGETIDTLLALKSAKEAGVPTVALINAEASSMAHEADVAIPLRAGVEVGVASTKALSAQIATLMAIGIALGKARSEIGDEVSGRCDEIVNWLQKTPALIEQLLENADDYESLGLELATARGYLCIGRGAQWPVAEEGSLKIKELAYVFSEAYAGGELKHGPLALVDESVWTIAVAPRDKHFEKMLSNVAEIRARGGKVLGIGSEGDSEFAAVCDRFIGIPSAIAEVQPLLTVVPFHLLAYWIARHKGNDIDQPRNLAKSVTVE